MNIRVIIAYFLIYVVWGSTYYFIGIALKGLPPFLLGTFRFTAAGLILLIWCWTKGELVFKKNLIKTSAISGIILLFIDMAVIMLAQKYVSSSFVAIMASSTAIWIMLFDAPMWKKNFKNPCIIAGVIMGFIGVAMLYIEQLNNTNESNHNIYGVLLLIFGCISWALGSLYTKYHSPEKDGINTFSGSAWQMIFAGLVFCICAIISGETTNINLKIIPIDSWLSLIYLILFGSILAYSAYIWLLKVRPATEVATHAYVNPFVAIFLGTALGGENVTWIQFGGLAIILISVVMINKKFNSKIK